MADRWVRCWIFAGLIGFGAGILPAFGGSPRAGDSPLSESGQMVIAESDRCPVCAMFPSKYPDFAAAIQLKNLRTYYFCCPGCMITAWLHPEAYLGAPSGERLRAVATHYFTGKHTDCRDLVWVAGSDVIGPMGPAVVPLRTREEIEAFRRRHGGSAVFTLDKLTDEQWQTFRKTRPNP
ncbi:MAG: nitrous oxide reductase accessory protein NosL [Desulfobacterales bacterium]